MLGDIVTMASLTFAFCGLAGAMLDDASPSPLRARLDGKRVGVIVCGGNVAPAKFVECLTSALAARTLKVAA